MVGLLILRMCAAGFARYLSTELISASLRTTDCLPGPQIYSLTTLTRLTALRVHQCEYTSVLVRVFEVLDMLTDILEIRLDRNKREFTFDYIQCPG